MSTYPYGLPVDFAERPVYSSITSADGSLTANVIPWNRGFGVELIDNEAYDAGRKLAAVVGMNAFDTYQQALDYAKLCVATFAE